MNLNELLRKFSRKLDIDFHEISGNISHAPKSGEARENALRSILKKLLPQRVEINSGFVFDAQGQESRQIDIVIFDKTVATIFDVEGINYFPCEAVIAVGEVKSDIDSRDKLRDALEKIMSVKKLDRSNKGKNLIVTGPGVSLKGITFNPMTQHRDQILGFVFTRTSMSKETVVRALQEYNSERERRFWLNLFCAYKKFLISYENKDEHLTPSTMDAELMYCTTEDEIDNLLLLFVSILATFVNEAHVARPNYFDYIKIKTTIHANYSPTT